MPARAPGDPSFVTLPASPSRDGAPTTLAWRERGAGAPLLLLHGGWGAAFYPFDDAMEALAADFRCLLPDRSGFGRSTGVSAVPLDFHARAAREMRAFLDALGVERACLWGHSDGAVIAAKMAIDEPERYPALVLEAFHARGAKPASRAFFETMAEAPERFGARVTDALAADHGARWRKLLAMNGRAWLALADSPAIAHDLYDGRLGEIRARVLFLHGARDPRTEPGEIEAAVAAIPGATLAMIPEGGHSPRTDRASAAEAVARAAAFLRGARAASEP